MTNRLSKKNELSMAEVVSAVIRDLKIASGLNEQLIFSARDSVSGAAAYTVSKYVRDNVLYCGISSSVIRNRLYYHRKEILDRINLRLSQDELFVKDDRKTGLLKDIVLR